MGRSWLIRLVLAAVLAAAGAAPEAWAQGCGTACPPPTPPAPTPTPVPTPIVTPLPPLILNTPPPSHRDNGKWYALGGVAIPFIGIAIKFQFDNIAGGTTGTGGPAPRSFPRVRPSQAQLESNLPSLGPATGPGAGATGRRRGFDQPPAGETRYRANEMLVESTASSLAELLGPHSITCSENFVSSLTRKRTHLCRGDGSLPVPDMITTAANAQPIGGTQITGAQPNYLYALAQSDLPPVNTDQYAPQKIHLPEALRLATGNRVLIAVIDSEVDASHPDLAGAITANFETSTDAEKPHSHGTGMAGAIAARRTMLGVAPGATLVTVRAFSTSADTVEGTTFNILKGLDWAAAQGARVVNMSFAGPPDPRLKEALAKANQKGMVLIAAAGNAGPNAAPLFPGADPSVIAVTATNAEDALYAGANRGNYIAVAAPGVDIFVPAPSGTYQFTTGTSVAAAEVSGIVALLLQRYPSLTPSEVRRILMSTATDLGPKGRDRDFGAGLVDALKALRLVKPASGT